MRVKRGVIKNKKRRKLRKLSKGYRGGRKLYRSSKETVMRSLAYAYRDRKNKKRNFRRLWIERINAGVRKYGLSYSEFINALKENNISLNRKILAEMSINYPEDFHNLVEQVRGKVSNAGETKAN